MREHLNHCTERDVPVYGGASVTASQFGGASVLASRMDALHRFYIPSNKATQTTLTATDQGKLVSGEKNIQAADTATVVNVGDKGTLNQSSVTKLLDASDITGGVAVTLNSGVQGNVLTEALDKLTTLNRDTVDATQSVIAQSSADTRSVLSQTLDKISGLAENKQTEGGKTVNQTILYIAGAAVVGLVLLNRPWKN